MLRSCSVYFSYCDVSRASSTKPTMAPVVNTQASKGLFSSSDDEDKPAPPTQPEVPKAKPPATQTKRTDPGLFRSDKKNTSTPPKPEVSKAKQGLFGSDSDDNVIPPTEPENTKAKQSGQGLFSSTDGEDDDLFSPGTKHSTISEPRPTMAPVAAVVDKKSKTSKKGLFSDSDSDGEGLFSAQSKAPSKSKTSDNTPSR